MKTTQDVEDVLTGLDEQYNNLDILSSHDKLLMSFSRFEQIQLILHNAIMDIEAIYD